jgi:metal-responsive CopG/Arc/MetJ family transcriptional regulator
MHCMTSSQVTVRLPSRLRAALEEAARRERRKASEVVRMALQAYLGLERQARGRPAGRVGKLIGSLASGTPGLAERHREYLLESVRRGR